MDRVPDVAVSADDVLGLVRLHVDRVHDAVLRAGCPAEAAVPTVEAGAADLPAAAATGSPAAELVGRWYAASLALAATARGHARYAGPRVTDGGPGSSARTGALTLSTDALSTDPVSTHALSTGALDLSTDALSTRALSTGALDLSADALATGALSGDALSTVTLVADALATDARSTHDRSTHDRSTHDRSTHDRSTHDRSTHARSTDAGPVRSRSEGTRSTRALPTDPRGAAELVRGALGRCDERDRTALLLADTYDLPADALGPALGLPVPDALRLVGRARLAVLPALAVRPGVGGDDPAARVRCTADTAGLARLAAGEVDRTATRHLRRCRACPDVVHAQRDVRGLLAGVPVTAVPEHERGPLLERLAVRARRELPAAGPAVAVPVLGPQRALRPAPALAWLAAAVLAGTALGVAGARPAPPRATPARVLDPVVAPPPPTLAAVALSPAPQPRTTVFTYPPTPTPTPSPTTAPPTPSPTRPSPSPTPAGQVLVAPATGPPGTPLRVTGGGWPAGSTVVVVLLGPRGARTVTSAQATAGPGGAFAVVLSGWRADAAAGAYAVVATSGPLRATGSYTAVAP